MRARDDSSGIDDDSSTGVRRQRRGAAEAWRVNVLGPICVVDTAGNVIELPSPSQRRLVAALSIGSARTCRPQHLADVLRVSDGALRTTVSRVRRLLGEHSLTTDSIGYRLRLAVDAAEFCQLFDGHRPGASGSQNEIDDKRFDALDRGLAMWTGDAFEEFSSEPWAVAEAHRLEELRATAIEQRAEALIVRRRCGEAVAAMETHIARFPLRDRPRALLMTALAADGRQTEALRAYQNYRSQLADAFGTEPCLEIRQLESHIASGSPSTPKLARCR